MMSKNTDTFSTSMNRVLAQSQCYCWFRVGLTGEPSKKQFAFPLARDHHRARSYVTEYVSFPHATLAQLCQTQ